MAKENYTLKVSELVNWFVKYDFSIGRDWDDCDINNIYHCLVDGCDLEITLDYELTIPMFVDFVNYSDFDSTFVTSHLDPIYRGIEHVMDFLYQVEVEGKSLEDLEDTYINGGNSILDSYIKDQLYGYMQPINFDEVDQWFRNNQIHFLNGIVYKEDLESDLRWYKDDIGCKDGRTTQKELVDYFIRIDRDEWTSHHYGLVGIGEVLKAYYKDAVLGEDVSETIQVTKIGRR